MRKVVKVLFVCMGNICRSPTADAVFRTQVKRAGLARQVQTDSAGTLDYHSGEPPDPRAQAAASKRGYDMKSFRARQIRDTDFIEYDYILAMDSHNLGILHKLCPERYFSKLGLFMEFSAGKALEVPDPYYGRSAHFEEVLDLIEDGAKGLLEHIQRYDLKLSATNPG
ncbi:MAG TPA: low molecular weight protein-tyrosine-phosphatase [Burkholderiales bacterium]|nr:low molecular weight protein-tyrosine-phosphatase [Burkholderiales bacterium]